MADEAKTKVLYTRVEPSLVAEVRREWRRQQKANKGMKLSQSDVIRALLWEVLKTRKGRAK